MSISHCNNRADAKAGFTLAEIAFAAAIMGGALALFMAAFSFAAKCIGNARNQTLAMNQAREVAEDLRRLPFRDPALIPGTYIVTSQLFDATVTISANGTEEKQLSISVPWTNYSLRANLTVDYDTVINSSLH